jgi:type I restriction enzyme M protein
MAKNKNNSSNGKTINSQAAMTKAVKSICDILRRDKAKGARLYVPELTWMFFLRYLDIMEDKEEQKSRALGTPFEETLAAPYRWRDWAAPFDHKISREETINKRLLGWKRYELDQPMGAFLTFVNEDLSPFLKTLGEKTRANNKQKVISEIFRNKEKTILASETNLQNALDKVHQLTEANISDQHMFPLSPRPLKVYCPAWGKRKTTEVSSSRPVRLSGWW